MTIKFINVDDPKAMRFPPGLRCPWAYMDTIEYGPTELRSIEWMELPQDVSTALGLIGQFPIELTEKGTRIVGYSC